jgi:prolyl oligopeptidase
MKYPTARKSDIVEEYHGVRVADPYRWLEDPDSPETVSWVDAENRLTRSVIDGSVREELIKRLTKLYDFPRTSVPTHRGRYYFFTHNTGLQDQPVLFVQEADGPRRVLIDPNSMSTDGPVALTALAIDDSGELAAYGLSRSGSDRQDIFIRRVEDGTDLPDRLLWVKFASMAWVKDGSGFYYTRFPEPGTVAPGDENYFNKVYYHRLGEDQSLDQLIFERPTERETVFGVEVSDNDRWVVITAFKGSSDRSEVYAIDRRSSAGTPVPLFTGFSAAYAFIESAGDRLLFRTDDRAPRGRIVSIDPLDSRRAAVEVVPESDDKLSSAAVIHQTIVAAYMHNASDALRMLTLSGEPAGQVALPEIGSLSGISGRPEDAEMFFGYTSFVHPAVNYRYDFTTRQLAPFGDRSSTLQLKSDEYETTQVWYPSKDGTRISMFLVSRKGLPKDGNCPVLLTGYGGFNISLTPAFDPSNFVLLEKGGIYAVPNLRGGGEYGEAWHEAGMFERKQNVFDDYIAAAEWLVASGYTSPKRIAIEGGSNGGLLTAAVMLQRPDLFGAVVCRVPVADMLRYHRFTVGRFWISEYGSADDPAQFPFLYRYSPLHNVVDGTPYPPILITTADTDDRVAPGMAKKFAARLQAAGHTAPALIRVETRAGHGAGKPLSKTIDEDADIFAFVFSMLQIEH